MGILKSIFEFIESIFKGNSPEFQSKQELKRIEIELKTLEPVIYKNGMLQPNMGEIFRLLYENTRYIYNILSVTLCSKDEAHNKKYAECLLETGFSPEIQDLLVKLSIENRKDDVITSDLSINKVLEAQKKSFEKVVKEASSSEFKKIDETIARLKNLYDFCCFDFVDMVQQFDPDYTGTDFSYKPNFQQILLDTGGSLLQDYYFVSGRLRLDSSMARALLALEQINKGDGEGNSSEKILSALKKINSIHTKILTPEVVKKLVLLWKKDSKYEVRVNSYSSEASKGFAKFLQTRFEADENRIKLEIKDRNVAVEQKKLFGETGLTELKGYNSEVNATMRQSASCTFNYITPMQVLKTFLEIYYTEKIRALLDDIVIEGFFNNNNLKSDFSAVVYAASEFFAEIVEFENSFDRKGDNDLALINGYIADSHKDPDFLRKLSIMVDNINTQAHKIVQKQVTGLRDLYYKINEMFIDSKKSKSDEIVNIKVLLSSSRNRDASQILEQQFPEWLTFFEIMKNYAIIGDVEKK